MAGDGALSDEASHLRGRCRNRRCKRSRRVRGRVEPQFGTPSRIGFGGDADREGGGQRHQRRLRSTRRGLLFAGVGHAVTDRAFAEDVVGASRVVAELAAEILHEDTHSVHIGGVTPRPRPVKQRVEGHDPCGVEREHTQQCDFGRGKFIAFPSTVTRRRS